MSDRVGFIAQDVALVDDMPMSTPWYRMLTDVYNYTGLAGSDFPMWNDVAVPATSMHVPASSAPDFLQFKGSILLPAFDAASAEELHLVLQLPHGYVGGTKFYPFVQWAPSDSSAGDVRWVLEWSQGAVGADFGASAEAVMLSSAPEASHRHTLFEASSIDGSALRYSSVIAARIYRDAANAADTYAADAFLISAGVHAMLGVPGTHGART